MRLTKVEKDIKKGDEERAASHSSSCADGTHLCRAESNETVRMRAAEQSLAAG